MTILYTARAHVQTGRDGSARTDDGKLEARLAFPKSLGGDGEGTNPEQLFAAGYGACFASTVATLAKAAGTPITEVRVDAEVELSSDGSHYDLAVRLRVHAAGVDQPTLARLAEKAKDTCPYSRALRSGVTTVTVG